MSYENVKIGKCENVKIRKVFVRGEHFHIFTFPNFPIKLLFFG